MRSYKYYNWLYRAAGNLLNYPSGIPTILELTELCLVAVGCQKPCHSHLPCTRKKTMYNHQVYLWKWDHHIRILRGHKDKGKIKIWNEVTILRFRMRSYNQLWNIKFILYNWNLCVRQSWTNILTPSYCIVYIKNILLQKFIIP